MSGNITTIGKKSFYGIDKVRSITIENDLTSIGEESFNGMTKLKTVVYTGARIPECGNNIFPTNELLTKIRVKTSTTFTNGQMFGNKEISKEIIENGKNGETVRYFIDTTVNMMMYGKGIMGTVTITNANEVKNVEIDEGITTITTVMQQFKEMITCKLPNGIITIEAQSYKECTKLTSIIIPSSVISIGNNCFYGCSSIQEINVD